jgi:hypothetical protein
MGGQTVQQKLAQRLADQFEAEAAALVQPQQQAFLTLGRTFLPAIMAAYSVLFRFGLDGSLNVNQPLRSMCADAAALLQPISENDETLRAAQLSFEATAGLVDALVAPGSTPETLVETGIRFGRAEVRLTQVISGLWEVMAAADVNASTAKLVDQNRKTGGAKRGAELKKQAAEWKAELLPVAIALDQKHPEWERQKLAQEIVWQAEPKYVKRNGEIKYISNRSVEDWLKNEAEEPRGPIRSRAQKQRA